jgi:succinate dehydrogenase / fumarate reductase membrane anchor subunit
LMKFASFAALLALVSHAWIGMWTVTTDYLKTAWFRLLVQLLIYITLLFYLVWGIQILWG